MKTKIIGILTIMVLIAPALSFNASAGGAKLEINAIDDVQLFDFSCIIENVGTEESLDVYWRIDLMDALLFRNRFHHGKLDSLEPGCVTTAQSNRIFGLGRFHLVASCGEYISDDMVVIHDSETYDVLVLGFFIRIL